MKGRKLRIERGDGDPAGTGELFTPIAGARQDSFSLAREPIDLSDKDDEDVRVLTGGGTKTCSLSVSGVSKTDDLLMAYENGAVENYRITNENGRIIEGPFLITAYDGDGDRTDAETFSATLESAGDYTITPAA